MPEIRIRQWSTRITTRRATILDAALSSGVPYPHGCRSGECGDCKTRVYAGAVDLDDCAPEALSPAERAGGLILACRARPKTDVEIGWLATMPAVPADVRRTKATVIEREDVTHDIVRLRLSVLGPFPFVAGQYAQLTFGGLPARPYSMASAPDEELVEFHVRRVPDGAVSGHVATGVRVGARLTIEGPFGTAYLRAHDDRPLVLVAGGSGLAPMQSILRVALAGATPRPIHLYHGVRDTADLYHLPEISEAAARHGVRFTPVLSMPSRPTLYRTGFVHEAVATDFRSLAGFVLYAAGPPPMVDAVRRAALHLGAGPDDVHADAFYAAPSERRPVTPRGGLLDRLFGTVGIGPRGRRAGWPAPPLRVK